MTFSIEDRLLIQCSRVSLDDQTILTALGLLEQELNWDYILQAAIVHGVAPLFYWGLSQLNPKSPPSRRIPPAIWTELTQLYQNNVARNRRLYKSIGEIWGAFQQEGLQAIGLKDLTLTRTIFPDIGLRPMGDLDILIHQKDYPRVEKCLNKLGYALWPGSDNPYSAKYAWGVHFHRATDNTWLDLQWGILQLEWDICGERNFDFDLDHLWLGARPVLIDDLEILALRPEDLLFHLCMHLEGHYYAELILFCDIAELLQQQGDQLDWDYFISRVKKSRVESSIYYVLLFVQQLFDCPLPNLLATLTPDYFKANLFEPLFGNLTALHELLDDIYDMAAPPTQTIAHFETIVRRQTACAIKWYEELDRLAIAASRLGVGPLIFEGASSEMIFPSLALQPFPEVFLLVLAQDRSKLQQALFTCGFENSTGLFKERRFTSNDPATGESPLSVKIRASMLDGLDALQHSTAGQTRSKKELAIKTLIGTLRSRPDNRPVQVHLRLAILTPEEMAFHLAARAGQHQQARLFALTGLLEFLRCYHSSIDWRHIAELARRYDQAEPVYAGLSMAQMIWGPFLSEQDLAQLDCPDKAPHVLQWARYGPAEMKHYTDFKTLFLSLFSWLATRQVRERIGYLVKDHSRLGRMWVSGGARLVVESVRSVFHPPKQYTVRDFAYWTEPEPDTSTMTGLQV